MHVQNLDSTGLTAVGQNENEEHAKSGHLVFGGLQDNTFFLFVFLMNTDI